MTRAIFIGCTVASLVINIAGLFCTILVIGCYLRCSQLRTVTNKYVLNLSVACLGSSIHIIFHSIRLLFYDIKWRFGETLCKHYTMITHVNDLAIGFFLAIICVDRYLVIVWPSSRTRFVSNVVVTATWIVSTLLCIPMYMFSSSKEEWYCMLTWGDNDRYEGHCIYFFILSFAVPLVLIVTFNILVAWRLKIYGDFNTSLQTVVKFSRSAADDDVTNDVESPLVLDESNRSADDREVNNDTTKVSLYVFIITAIWTLSSISYKVCHLMLGFKLDYLTYFIDTLNISFTTKTLGMVLLPTLYALLNDSYRKCAMKLLTCAAVRDVNASLREERSDQGTGVGLTV